MNNILGSVVFLILVVTACRNNVPAYRGLNPGIVVAERDSLLTDTIIYHPVRIDQDGHILPWYSARTGESYDDAISRVWSFWKNIATDSNGLKYYMNHQVWSPEHDHRGLGGDQLQMALSSWDLLYDYTGDSSILENMKYMADYYLDSGMSSPGIKWPDIPYPYNTDIHSGVYDGDMILGRDFLQPDKGGSFGFELIKLFKKTGDRKYLNSAVKIANTLAAKITPGDKEHSPWPFKVNAVTGETGSLIDQRVWYEGMSEDIKKSGSQPLRSAYTTNWTGTLELLSGLINLGTGDTSAYRRAFDIALNWMKTYPVVTDKWGPFFEDVPGWSDTQINAVTYAMYILDHPRLDTAWEKTVKHILQWVHKELEDRRYIKYGVITTDEQTAYRQPGNSHSARQGAVELMFWENTGDTTFVRNAVRQLNWATYMVDFDGKNFYPTNAVWMTDGYGDYVRHYLRAMAAAPELAPENANHLLRSSSVIRKIDYGVKNITYTTFDKTSQEEFRLTGKPRKIINSGRSLPEIGSPGADGWYWLDLEKGGILQVRHSAGNTVQIILPES